MAITAYIALGSNLGNPSQQLQSAVKQIQSEKGIKLQDCSSLYQSDPIGVDGQPDYCNAVISIFTRLSPMELLNCLQSIENKHGRVRDVRWGARTLDLDILLYGDQIIKNEQLTIPHNQMHRRSFVLYPLNDITPNLVIPKHGKLSVLLDKVGFNGLRVISTLWS